MTERHLRITEATDSADRGALLPNGTLWSHAVTPGKYFRGGEFTIGQSELESFVANFERGYPSKVPVDYEHTSTNGATLDGPQPKAGDVVEMHAVLSEADLLPEIKDAIARTEAEWSQLGIKKQVNPLGLWVRWRPTARAHQMLKAREYTEMSIAFNDTMQSNTGELQGPTLLAIALTNRPFVDTMASIAASADGARNPERKVMKFFSILSANRGKPVTNEDEATTELTALSERAKTAEQSLTAATSFVDVVAAEFGGEKDGGKVLAKIRELKAANADLTTKLASSNEGKSESDAEAIILKHEAKLTKPAREMFKRQLAAELKAGKKAGETEVEQVLSSLPPIPGTTQSSGGDGGKGLDGDAALAARAKDISEKDPVISKIEDGNQRQLQALTKARHELASANGSK